MQLFPRLRTAAELSKFATPPPSWPDVGGPYPDALTAAIARQRLAKITREEGMRIPAMRRGVHVIAGTISTFALAMWTGPVRVPAAQTPAWLGQPDPDATLQTWLRRIVEDLIWHDKSYARVTRDVGGNVKYVRRISPSRIVETHNPSDVDELGGILLDGTRVANTASIVRFDGAGLGGIEAFGADILDLYLALQLAAGNYADAPHPKGVLKNTGADLDDDEIDALLDRWEESRRNRSVGYLNGVLDYQAQGWNARELQLVEAREHAALEVARMLGLPSRTLNAATNDAMTYSNDTAARRDTLEALRPWMSVIEQTLGMDDRTGVLSGRLTPRGVSVRFDADAYTRDDPETRMRIWQAGLAMKLWTVEDIKRQEPLAWN